MPIKKPIQSAEIAPYAQLTLPELEAKLEAVLKKPVSNVTKQTARVIRVAMRDRKIWLKQQVMEFEEGNDRYLLVYESTDGYQKMAGHSVLFFSLKIAERLHRRCNVLADSDTRFCSEEGIVSVRGWQKLQEQLLGVNVVLDEEKSTTEMHFFRLPRIYTEAEIAKLRDFSEQDLKQIQEIILPKSPMPLLYRDILEVNRLVYHGCRAMSDTWVRQTLGTKLMLQADAILQSYLDFGGVSIQTTKARQELQIMMSHVDGLRTIQKPWVQAQNMMNIWVHTRKLHNRMANIENLRVIHLKEIGKILALLVKIERTAEREFGTICRERERLDAEK